MQDMIAQIVEMDQKAREITDEAQREKVRSEQEIVQTREKIREEYLIRARKRIRLNEVTERKAAEEELAAIQQRNAETAQKLEDLYAQKGDEWVAMLVKRVIEE